MILNFKKKSRFSYFASYTTSCYNIIITLLYNILCAAASSPRTLQQGGCASDLARGVVEVSDAVWCACGLRPPSPHEQAQKYRDFGEPPVRVVVVAAAVMVVVSHILSTHTHTRTHAHARTCRHNGACIYIYTYYEM